MKINPIQFLILLMVATTARCSDFIDSGIKNMIIAYPELARSSWHLASATLQFNQHPPIPYLIDAIDHEYTQNLITAYAHSLKRNMRITITNHQTLDPCNQCIVDSMIDATVTIDLARFYKNPPQAVSSAALYEQQKILSNLYSYFVAPLIHKKNDFIFCSCLHHFFKQYFFVYAYLIGYVMHRLDDISHEEMIWYVNDLNLHDNPQETFHGIVKRWLWSTKIITHELYKSRQQLDPLDNPVVKTMVDQLFEALHRDNDALLLFDESWLQYCALCHTNVPEADIHIIRSKFHNLLQTTFMRILKYLEEHECLCQAGAIGN